MEDYTKYILYAVIAVLYILFKIFRKKKPATTNDSPIPNSQPVEPSYSGRSTEDDEEPYVSPTETDDEPSTFKGSIKELLKEFVEGPKHEEFGSEPLDREDELREEISDSEYQDEERETEEIEIIADPPPKTYERAGESTAVIVKTKSEQPTSDKISAAYEPDRAFRYNEETASAQSLDKESTAYNIEEEEKSKYAQILQDPQNAKEAFIMSEIFKKKYE